MIKELLLLGLSLLPLYLRPQSGNGILPIKASRTITFSTTVGSNMSVDISPNGKLLVFDILGNLYTMPVKGGIAKQLTSGMALNARPVWSPKGDNIACISDASGTDKLTVIDTAGSFVQSFGNRENGTPVWNAAGDWLTSTSRKPSGEYFIYYLGGGKEKLALDINKVINFSPDHKFMYYEAQKATGDRCIMRYDMTSGSKSIFFEFGAENDVQLHNIKVAPDGRWVSYLILDNLEYRLVMVDLIEKRERVLAQWQCMVPNPWSGAHQYGVTPDSKKIVIGYGGQIHLIEVLSGKSDIIPFLAHVKIDMGKLNDNHFKLDQSPFPVKYIRYAHASPDGKRLVFAALCRIYIMDLPNGIPHLLSDQPVNQFQPAWSPDGQWIAYSSWSDTAFGQVWKASINGEAPVQITREPGVYHNPAWSHDGKHIVVGKGARWWDGKPWIGGRDGPGYGKLLKISIDDGMVKVIADSIPLTNRASFSLTDDSIVYSSFQDKNVGKAYPYLISQSLIKGDRIIASGQQQFGLRDEFFMRQIIASPDGKYVVYLRQENLHLVPMSGTGQSTQIYDETQQLPVIRFARGGFDPHWEQQGKILTWSYANKYYQIHPEKIVKAALLAAKTRVKSGLAERTIIDVDIIPDKTITINLKATKKVSTGALALKNARIITMQGDKVIEKGTLLISRGRVVAVGNNDQVKIPTGTRVMDLTGKTIIPGLIDLHDHLGLPAEIFPQHKWELMANLAYGITTAREPSGSYDSFGYEELIETGSMVGPRLFNVGRAVRDRPYYEINNLSEARVIVQNRARVGGTVVKQYTQDTRLKRQWLLLACEEEGLNMTNEVEQDIKGFLGQIKDGSSGIEHNPLWGEAHEDVIKLLVASGTYITPTLQVPYGTSSAKLQFDNRFCKVDEKLIHFFPPQEIERRCKEFKNLENEPTTQNIPSFLNHSRIDATIHKQGGKVAMGSHGEDPGIGAHFEIWALQMGGLTNIEALRSASIMAAGALGMQKDLGSIENGKIADLLILDKNPLDNIQYTIDIRWVMKDGILYNGNTLEIYNP